MTQIEQCPKCGKPSGFKGYRGAECQCGVKLGSAVKGAPSVGTMLCGCPERLVDMVCYGTHICRDGKRIAPEDFYITEPESGPEPTGEDT